MKPRKHYIVLFSYRISIIVARYDTIVEPGTLRNWRGRETGETGEAPTAIINLLGVKDAKYNLRGTNMLSLPKVRSTKHGLRSFRYFAAKTWNALPDSIRAMGAPPFPQDYI